MRAPYTSSANMGDLEERIVSISKEKRDLERAKADILETVGKYVYDHSEALPFTQEDAAYAKVTESAKQLRGIEAKIATLEEAQRRQAAIKQEIANTRARIAAIDEDMGPLYETIGRAAFAVFQDNPFIGPPYAGLFQELSEEIQGLEEVHQELTEEERDIDEKAFLDRMIARGKVTWLKSRKQSREHSLEKHFRDAGKKIVETDFADVVEDPGLNSAVRPYEHQRRRIETLREHIRSLEADLTHHEEESKERPPKGSSQDDLDHQKRLAQAQLTQAQRELGNRFLKGAKKTEIPEEIADEAEAARKIVRQLSTKSREERRLKESLRRQELEKQAHLLKGRIEEMKNQTRELEDRHTQLIQEIEDLSGEEKTGSPRKKAGKKEQ
jgi:hypothetical protein